MKGMGYGMSDKTIHIGYGLVINYCSAVLLRGRIEKERRNGKQTLEWDAGPGSQKRATFLKIQTLRVAC